MTVPYVEMPNPWLAVLTLLRTSPFLPASLSEKVFATIPDGFPADLPLLHVDQSSGGEELVPLRLARASFDFTIYHTDRFEVMELARKVVAVTKTLEQRSTDLCGITQALIDTPPFTLTDPDTGAERAIVSVSVTYRPV